MPPPWLYLPLCVALPLALLLRFVAVLLAAVAGVVWRPSLTPESVRGLCYRCRVLLCLVSRVPLR